MSAVYMHLANGILMQKCAEHDHDYEPTDGLLDRNGYETRKCCNCGDVADFFVRTYYGDCDGPSLPDPFGRDVCRAVGGAR